ncbi:selenocysteine-specific translation elongation factor [Marihabitans asiaticum]|uniref:Selenocysteine-specific elongation factor n=1 Tax=Marihabitans asiaticum TaxID=415218 RepID=A0A560WEQ0_9MICO|nr:selenocysteine-specific translation elongation factor [Marihabitans asiaticum]TWD16046.1 selenocysteine-specific elongation factor [Marihabitans asiaticum]
MRRVLATAGHVDHGKSTLVRALTGRDPDRLDEEHRRGLTIELGFAWTTLHAAGEALDVAFVDVPGHRRFIGTTLSGLGPAPGVLLVVAADQGWQEQTSEHVAAMRAIGVDHVLLAVTRADLADPDPVRRDALTHLAELGWHEVPSCVVSARTGEGVDSLRAALAGFVAGLPEPDVEAPVRLWVDRAFTIDGAGTVVTGTLGAGRLLVEDELVAVRADGRQREVVVRGLQSEDTPRREVTGVSRVAANLRQARAGDLGRGTALLTPDAWRIAGTVDVALAPAGGGEPPAGADLVVHVGTADTPAHVRPLGPDHARVQASTALPWRIGDRLLLRDPGSRRLWGGTVVDVDPKPLRRRGAAAARGQALAGGDLRAVRLAEHGVQTVAELEVLGLGQTNGAEVRVGDLVVDPDRWAGWRREAGRLLDEHRRRDPVSAGIPAGALAQTLGLPARLVPALAQAADLEVVDGTVRRPGADDLGPAEDGLRTLLTRLTSSPFAAPEADDLAELALGPRELAAAARQGRLLRLPGEVVLLPDGPARAMRVLAGLEQPFTVSTAREALGTTRRVAVPLLEHLDERGWTRRLDGSHREVVR